MIIFAIRLINMHEVLSTFWMNFQGWISYTFIQWKFKPCNVIPLVHYRWAPARLAPFSPPGSRRTETTRCCCWRPVVSMTTRYCTLRWTGYLYWRQNTPGTITQSHRRTPSRGWATDKSFGLAGEFLVVPVRSMRCSTPGGALSTMIGGQRKVAQVGHSKTFFRTF